METHEADTPTNTTVLRQRLAQDDLLRRSSMTATGSLVHGFMQQIKRCDLPLGAAWFANIGGPDRAHLQCQNMSINPAPADCQWTPFWEIQANASGPFKDAVRGIDCGRWEWWSDGLQYLLRVALRTPFETPSVLRYRLVLFGAGTASGALTECRCGQQSSLTRIHSILRGT